MYTGKSRGLRYAPVYKAKKYPRAAKKKFNYGRPIAICALLFAMVTGVMIWRASSVSSEVTASGKRLEDVSEYPRVVNSQNALDASYEPENLTTLGNIPNGENVLLRRDAAESFTDMLEAMAEDGLAVVPVGGYVTYDEQEQALSACVDSYIALGYSSEKANELALQQLFVAGEDEAQLGTSIDVSTSTSTTEGFESTEQYEWLCSNAYKFGFIVRYTSDKEDITGVSARAWRLRYVGEEVAEYMAANGLCLEEYVSLVISDNPTAQQAD